MPTTETIGIAGVVTIAQHDSGAIWPTSEMLYVYGKDSSNNMTFLGQTNVALIGPNTLGKTGTMAFSTIVQEPASGAYTAYYVTGLSGDTAGRDNGDVLPVKGEGSDYQYVRGNEFHYQLIATTTINQGQTTQTNNGGGRTHPGSGGAGNLFTPGHGHTSALAMINPLA